MLLHRRKTPVIAEKVAEIVVKVITYHMLQNIIFTVFRGQLSQFKSWSALD